MYLVDRKAIEDNVASIRKAFEDEGIDLMLCYSYKTNMMPQVVKIMDDLDVCPEVVSDYEYKTAAENAFFVVCNGVAMSYNQLADRILGGDAVNFNDRVSIERVVDIAGEKLNGRCVGLRVRFSEDSRFGVNVDDVAEVVDFIEKNGMRLACLHCHVTGTRELSKYRQKVKALVNVVIENGLHPDILDFGGSMYGKMDSGLKEQFEEVGSFDDYAKIASEEISRLDYKPKIMLELGTALIANAVSIKATVVRVDEYGRAVLDIDKYTVGQMIYKDVPYTILPSRSILSAPRPAYMVFGCSCIEDDVLIRNFEGELAVGDTIVFQNCGAYSYCFEPEFIIPRQEVQVI